MQLLWYAQNHTDKPIKQNVLWIFFQSSKEVPIQCHVVLAALPDAILDACLVAVPYLPPLHHQSPALIHLSFLLHHHKSSQDLQDTQELWDFQDVLDQRDVMEWLGHQAPQDHQAPQENNQLFQR